MKASSESSVKEAILYMVATPLGNLEDITYRAVRILGEVDLIFSEDTRKTGILLNHYGLKTPQKSFRVHHLQQDLEKALASLAEGKKIAFCTDAGTPGISDPGSALVREIRSRLPEIQVHPIPGPSALAAALSVCGWQTNPSLFAGFLSPKKGRRQKAISGFSSFEGIVVLYESVHRIEKLLQEIHELLPEREVFVAREMTKVFEDYRWIRTGLDEEEFDRELESLTKKGEFTVIVGPEAKKRLMYNSGTTDTESEVNGYGD